MIVTLNIIEFEQHWKIFLPIQIYLVHQIFMCAKHPPFFLSYFETAEATLRSKGSHRFFFNELIKRYIAKQRFIIKKKYSEKSTITLNFHAMLIIMNNPVRVVLQ